MSEFGGDTVKPTELYGNPWANLLYRAQPKKGKTKSTKKLVSVNVKEDGTRSVTGNAKELKESQAYPERFGEAVCSVFLKTRPGPLELDFDDDGAVTASDTDDDWADKKARGQHVAVTRESPEGVLGRSIGLISNMCCVGG